MRIYMKTYQNIFKNKLATLLTIIIITMYAKKLYFTIILHILYYYITHILHLNLMLYHKISMTIFKIIFF